MGFIKKVYGILFVQLLITALWTAVVLSSEPIQACMNAHREILWICIVISLVIVCVLSCCVETARKVPMNYILLFAFTGCESYMVSFACMGVSDKNIVIMAAAMTCTIVLALTIYACVTDTDFTTCGGILFCAFVVLLLFGLFAYLTDIKTLNVLYCCASLFLFSMYLIYDTQLIVGRGQNRLTYDDYIFGALQLYLDIVIIFLDLLRLLDGRGR